MKDINKDNCKMIMKEIKEYQKERSPIFIGWKNIIKMSILPNTICRLNAIPTKISILFFTELEIKRKVLKFIWKHKKDSG